MRVDPSEPNDLPAKLDDLGALIARSQRLKEEAARKLEESAALDREIEKTINSSIESARERGRSGAR